MYIECAPGQGLSQEMIDGSSNLLIVVPGWGTGSSHNAIWWNLVIIFFVQAENRPSRRRLDGSLAKSLLQVAPPVIFVILHGLSASVISTVKVVDLNR